MKINLLDHGFVVLRNVSGPTRRVNATGWGDGVGPTPAFDADDTDPANTARMSFDNIDSARPRELDLKLCDYLMKNKHTTPFEMIEVWLEMKLPLFVARQFVRHRTCTINEVSGRYVTLPAEWYIPKPEHVGYKPKSAKQGRVVDGVVSQQVLDFVAGLDHACRNSYMAYTFSIENGIAPELARLFLHTNHYTHWVWKQDLHNIMHFLSLRDHSHAQYEAQQFAKAITELLTGVLPNCMELYRKYRRMPE